MNNTTLILVLAVGGIAVYAMTRKPAVARETVIVKPQKLTQSQKVGGAVGDLMDYFSWG